MTADRAGDAPQWARRPGNLTHAVTADLVARIVRGQYAPGTALPPEPALGRTFSVSRSVVREAVKMLQEKGLVQVRQGAGTTVNPPTTWNLLDEQVLAAGVQEPDGLALLDDLVVTRRLLEADMAHVTAREATPEIVAELRDLVDRMDALVDDPEGYLEHDRAFHDVVMRTSGNRIARAVVRALESQVVRVSRYMGRPHRDQRVASNRGHRRVAEAIAAADPAAASAAMSAHITEAWLVRREGPTEPTHLQR
jgi:DNA-binding FadR family transcriptional regulator